MPTVCILYGFGEGPRVAQRFRRALLKAGYEVITNAEGADIIITHSGGGFLLPEKIRAQHIIHIGLAYWPGKPWLASMVPKLVRDVNAHRRVGALGFWLRKTSWNLWYAVNMVANLRMLRGKKRGTHWRHAHVTTVVRPRFDTFAARHPSHFPFQGHARFITLGEHHDDCWRDPGPCIALLQSLVWTATIGSNNKQARRSSRS